MGQILRTFRHAKKLKWAVAAIAIALALACLAVPARNAFATEAVGVSFDANGPATVVHTETGEEAITVPEIELDFEGLEFTGEWNTTRRGTGDAYVAGDMLAESMTLYAQWEDGTYLFTAVDTAALDAAIEKAESLDLSQYTDKTAQAVEDPLSTAQALSSTETDNQTEVDAAADALNTAIDSLEEKSLVQKAVDAITGGGESSASSSVSGKSGSAYAKTGAGVLPVVIGIALMLVAAGSLAAVHLRKRKELERRRALYLNIGQPTVKTSRKTSRRLNRKRANR